MLALYLLVLTVNIITEVIKRLIPVPTDLVVFLVSIGVTMLTLFITVSVLAIRIRWYYLAGGIILGLFVAYAAMFGFGKFKELWERLNECIK